MKAALLALLFCAWASTPSAEPRPKWELGVGATAFTLPDYRGSDERRSYLFPLPFLVYRGESVRVDRQGVRGIFFESERVQFDFSINGTPPVDSSKNQARQGMPDLDPTLEIGPLLNITLLRDKVDGTQLDLRLPMRAVIATDFSHAQGAGWVFSPNLALNMRPDVGGGRWNLGVNTGPIFASSKYHEYYYGVAPQFATPDRPAYSARGGYSGWMGLVSLSRRYQKLWVGGFARYDVLSGAAFEDSPLVRRHSAYMAGIAAAWIIAESESRVDVFEPYY
ncbi:MAG TPA: MipA/OmpV family protein [Burkholderiales bacterium]|nr:MipA/OmpV family protein [Burkholderiales bacterium]